MKKDKKYLSSGELSSLCLQMSLMLRAGIPLNEGLSMLRDDSESEKGKEILQTLYDGVSDKLLFYQALNDAGVFPQYMINTVKVGEASGKLDDALYSLASYYERMEELRKHIQSAAIFPFILVTMMSVVLLILVAKILPIFEDILSSLGTEFSGVVGFSVLTGKIALIIMGVVFLVIITIIAATRTSRGKAWARRTLISFPLAKGLAIKIATGRFASSMATLISSGLNIGEALAMSPDLVENPTVKARINECIRLVGEDYSFADAITKSGVFKGVHSRMISIGFRVGIVDEILTSISDTYNDEIDKGINKIVSAIEPTLVAILAIVIGIILIGVMLPLMNIMSAIG